MTEGAGRLARALGGRYSVEGELGRGGTAAVYLARDLKHDRAVALKVLRREVAATVGAERFIREIRLAARLSHPHILPVHESGEADGFLYYVMPYVEGESLRARLEREEQLPVEDALTIAAEVADALAFAHEHGVLHRDIKPENILLAENHALVADFGVARAVDAAGDDLTGTGMAVGTPSYMSPEQATGTDRLDARSDLYALGCVLYEMLAGTPPFTARTSQAVLAKHLTEPPPSLGVVRDAGPEVEEILERTLAKTPADRFKSAEELREALTRVLRSRETAGGRPASDSAVRWRWAGWAVAGLAAAVLGVLAARGGTDGDTEADRVPGDPDRLNQIAVLPFEDRSPSGEFASFALGLTHEMVSAMGQVSSLSVRSLAAVRPLAGSSAGLDSLARLLEVGTVVEGYVEPVRDRLRLTVHLVEAKSGAVLGGPVRVTAPRDSPDSLRAMVGERVAPQLRRRLGERVAELRRREASANPAARLLMERTEEHRSRAAQAYLTGELAEAWRLLVAADSLAGEASRRAPRWPEPLLARGWIALQLGQMARSAPLQAPEVELRSPDAWYREGLASTEEVLARRPGDAAALELRGALRLRLWRASGSDAGDTLPGAAQRDLGAAVEAEPGRTRAWVDLAGLLREQGRFAESEAVARRALESDAYLRLGAENARLRFFQLLEQGEYEEARALCEAGRWEFPDDVNFRECRLTLLGWTGSDRRDVREAWAELRQIEEAPGASPRTWGDRRMMVAAVLARAGLGDSARAVVRRTRDGVPAELAPDLLFPEAFVRLLLGERAEAVRLLEAYVEARPRYRDYVARYPWFRSLRDDSVFRRMVAGEG